MLTIYCALLVSTLIWNINQNLFGNPFLPCFFLSFATFLIIFTPFEIYFTFRDFWYERWKSLDIDELESTRIKIEVEAKKNKIRDLSALLIKSKNLKRVAELNSLIIIAQGFSDTKESLQRFYIPFVQLGFSILIYDARGMGASKKVGSKGDFLSRINDFKAIVNWIKNEPDLNEKKLFSIGFSIGALTILCAGLSDERIEKIIAISAISNYRKNLPKYNVIAMLSYLVKGVRLFPPRRINEKISPIFHINKLKNESSKQIWDKLSKRIFLVHSRNDKIIKIKNFIENRDALNLPDENQLVLNKGGHNLKKDEMILQGALFKFLMN